MLHRLKIFDNFYYGWVILVIGGLGGVFLWTWSNIFKFSVYR